MGNFQACHKSKKNLYGSIIALPAEASMFNCYQEKLLIYVNLKTLQGPFLDNYTQKLFLMRRPLNVISKHFALVWMSYP